MIERAYYRVKFNTDTFVYVAQSNISLPNKIEEFTDDVIYSTDIGATIDTTEKWTLADGSIVENIGCKRKIPIIAGDGVIVDADSTNKYVQISIDKDVLDTKYDKAGGTIGGDVIITGDLTVNGTQHINNTENLAVKNAMIYSNSDGATLATNGGIGIKKNATDIYGIVYDPTSDSVKLGLGKSDGNGNFTFNKDEGDPVAIRDDSSKFTNDHLAKWDATNKKFVDSGYLPENFAKLDGSNTFTKTVFSKNAFEGESLRSQWKNADNTIRNRIQIAAKNNDRNFPGSQITFEEIDTTAGSKLVTVYQRGSIKELEFDGVTTWGSGNGNLKTSYEWMFPKKSGTFALLEDVAGVGSSTTFSVEVW